MIIAPSSSSHYFGSFFSKLASFYTLYQYTRFNFIKITFVPSVATTTIGTVAIGFNPDPRAVAPTSGNEVTGPGSLHISHVSDIKTGFSITLPGKMLHETSSLNGPWLTNNSSASLEQQAEGVVQLGSLNGLATSNAFGYLQFDVSVTFREFKP
jgi:hypothetical protein